MITTEAPATAVPLAILELFDADMAVVAERAAEVVIVIIFFLFFFFDSGAPPQRRITKIIGDALEVVQARTGIFAASDPAVIRENLFKAHGAEFLRKEA